jgi:hypothetical protein
MGAKHPTEAALITSLKFYKEALKKIEITT